MEAAAPSRQFDEEHCKECGNLVKKTAVICLKCGVARKQPGALPIERKSKTTAIVLAVFFTFFTWAYTYKRDSGKFWLSLILTAVTVGFFAIAAWIWAVILAVSRSEEWYEGFPNEPAA